MALSKLSLSSLHSAFNTKKKSISFRGVSTDRKILPVFFKVPKSSTTIASQQIGLVLSENRFQCSIFNVMLEIILFQTTILCLSNDVLVDEERKLKKFNGNFQLALKFKSEFNIILLYLTQFSV